MSPSRLATNVKMMLPAAFRRRFPCLGAMRYYRGAQTMYANRVADPNYWVLIAGDAAYYKYVYRPHIPFAFRYKLVGDEK